MRGGTRIGKAGRMRNGRPRVALHITPRLFRDALARALAEHVDVVFAPDPDADWHQWPINEPPFDLAIVSAGNRIVDLEADLVVEIPLATGEPIGTVREDGRSVASLSELLELLPQGRR